MTAQKKIAHSIQAPQDEGMALWLNAAYEILVEQGVDKIRIGALAKKVSSTRTAFYWYFASREELLDTLIKHWQTKNTDNLVARIDSYAQSINEAIFNMFDCWLDKDIFDSDLDFAVRNWAGGDSHLAKKVAEADKMRIASLIHMFERFGYSEKASHTRAHNVYYTQIGYISMMVKDDPEERLDRMPEYAQVYTGQKPTALEIDRFFSRHR